MLRVCKLLLLMIFISPTYVVGANIDSSALKAREVYFDAKNDLVRATGDVFIQMDSFILNAQKIVYDLKDDVIFAEGDVQITDKNGRIMRGDKAIFKDKLKQGAIEGFIAKFDDNSILAARLAKRLNKNRVSLEKSVFTPCEINCGNKPIWQIRSGHTDVDYDREKITYKHLFFELYGIPVIYLPYLSHPTPGASAQSGLLVPEIKKDNFMLPFYFRVKPNVDFTISPRLSKNYTIFEGEYRHRVEDGQYEVDVSYGNPAFKKERRAGVISSSNPGRYHAVAKGGFSRNNINYGFDIQRASDKAYLTNYQERYDSYLTSRIYTNNINRRNYFQLEGYYFQDLRDKNSQFKTPLILPSVRTQHIVDLSGNETTLLNIRNNTMVYSEPKELQLARTALELEVMTNLISNNGHMLTFGLANRGDLYVADLKEKEHSSEKQRVWYRNIPEINARWRYPLAKSIGSKASLKIEPTAMVVLGRKYEKRFEKFILVDAPKNELSENNIFSTNRFSGIDYHEYGSRLSYGLNSTFASGPLYVDAFLGQLVYKDNVVEAGNSEYVGSVRADIFSNASLFYRFRRDQSLKPIRNEIGLEANTDSFLANLSFAEFHQISRYFSEKDFKVENDKVAQLGLSADYKIYKNLSIGGETRLDVTTKSPRVLLRTIRMTYMFDCVSISGSITDNFLHDSLRGVQKTRSQSFSVRLKVLNM
jgi:LPS-assembly protein